MLHDVAGIQLEGVAACLRRPTALPESVEPEIVEPESVEPESMMAESSGSVLLATAWETK